MRIAGTLLIKIPRQASSPWLMPTGDADHFMNERIGDVRILANNKDIVDTTASVSLKQDTLSHAITQYGDTYHDMLMVDMNGKLIASAAQMYETITATHPGL